RLPEVTDLSPLASLAGHPGLIIAERGGAPAEGLDLGGSDEALLVIGPEGGFSDAEVAQLGKARRLDLGPHVLRAETAAVAAAAVVTVMRRIGLPGGGEPRQTWLE
ncbi:MAG: RsmE family RNA methyltransferase, partial [Acidimicrobiia bacterium]